MEKTSKGKSDHFLANMVKHLLKYWSYKIVLLVAKQAFTLIKQAFDTLILQ